MLDIIGQLILWLGGIVVLIGSIGLLRFPDFYTRSHAATVATVGGFSLSLIGIALLSPIGSTFFKVLLILIVNLFTNPTITHALADSAHRVGIYPLKAARDDLNSGRKKK